MIRIKTKLHHAIYKSCGGGEVTVHYEWRTNVRNLLKAAQVISKHREEMRSGYGNVGSGRTWLEVDGTVVDIYDENDLRISDKDMGVTYAPRTRTDKATELLAKIAS